MCQAGCALDPSATLGADHGRGCPSPDLHGGRLRYVRFSRFRILFHTGDAFFDDSTVSAPIRRQYFLPLSDVPDRSQMHLIGAATVTRVPRVVAAGPRRRVCQSTQVLQTWVFHDENLVPRPLPTLATPFGFRCQITSDSGDKFAFLEWASSIQSTSPRPQAHLELAQAVRRLQQKSTCAPASCQYRPSHSLVSQ